MRLSIRVSQEETSHKQRGQPEAKDADAFSVHYIGIVISQPGVPVKSAVAPLATIPYWADTARAKAELGFAPKYPTVEDGIVTCV